MNKRIVQNKQDSKNFILCFEKKKKASPTIEYIFTNVPSNMTNAAQKFDKGKGQQDKGSDRYIELLD